MIDYTGMFEKIAGRSTNALFEEATRSFAAGARNSSLGHQLQANARLTPREKHLIDILRRRGNQQTTAAKNRVANLGRSIYTHQIPTPASGTGWSVASDLLNNGFTAKDLKPLRAKNV